MDSHFVGVAELASALRRRRVSSVELAQDALSRCETIGTRFNAIATITRERALEEARAADRTLKRGTSSALVGIPYGAKDLLAAKGAPTTWGAPPYRDQVFEEDATVIAKLRRAGAVLAAKLATVELAGGGGYRYPSASLQGPGRNPWNADRWSGGSSSGPGAAVAAGVVPYALGSETSGSIGTPSAFCGVTGVRPTYGLVSRHGAMALSWTLDKIGPMARSAEDCALVLAAIAGADPLDPTTSGKRFAPLAGRAATSALRRLRVGYAEEDIGEHANEIAKRALERGVAEFKRLSKRFVRVTLPDLPYGPMVTTVMGGEAATIFADLIAGDRFGELVDARQKAGLRSYGAILARDYLHAQRLRTQLIAEVRGIFAQVDLILTIGRANTAPAIDAALDARPPGMGSVAAGAKPTGNIAMIAAGNLAGLPAVFFPCGFGTDGLPVGLQVVGPPWSEPVLLAVVAAYQRETEHHGKRPKLS